MSAAEHARAAHQTEPLLDVRDLGVSFTSEAGVVSAVRSMSYQVRRGEVLGIVGESGSGKSVSSLAVMGLLPPHATVSGSVRFNGEELLGRSDRELSAIRGRRVEGWETEELLAPYGEWAGLAGVYLLSAWARGLLPVSPAERRAA